MWHIPRCLFNLGRLLLAAIVSMLHLTAVAGRPLEDQSFSLRFPAATSRFAPYADVAAMGGAQAASKWSSSTNPASAVWAKLDQKYSFSPQFSLVGFGAGTQLYIASEALTIDAGPWGQFLPATAQVLSNHKTGKDGLGFRFEAQYFQLQWGKKIAKNWAIGTAFNLTVSDTRFSSANQDFGRTRSETYNFRLGVVHQLFEKLRVGLVLDYAFVPSRTTSLKLDLSDLTLTPARSYDTSRQFLLRTGVAWEYATGCEIYFDYQGAAFEDQTGTLQSHRFFTGLEHSVIQKVLFIRAGAAIDTYGNAAATVGLGLTLNERVSVDIAYQHDMLPEVRREFGVARTLVTSMALGF